MLANRIGLLRVYLGLIRQRGLAKTARKFIDPSVLRLHLKRIASGNTASWTNYYAPSASREEEASFCASLLGVSETQVLAWFDEVENGPYADELEQRFFKFRTGKPMTASVSIGFSIGRFKMWYAMVRALRPATVIETGVHDGLSTALILKALDKNQHGHLISIDLPNTEMPIGHLPGWLVPDRLHGRWTLLLGDAKDLLPKTAAEHAPIDLFVHDSDHRADHQAFEFDTVLPHMAPGGLLISDQDFPHETVLPEVAARIGGRHARVRSDTGSAYGGIDAFAGGVRLPVKVH